MSETTERSQVLKGPRSGFFFGNLRQIGPKGHLTFKKWTSEYGPICGVHLGPMGKGIVLGDYDVLKKAYEGSPEVFSGRFVIPIIKTASKGYGTLLWENNEDWEKRSHLFHCVMGKLDLDKLAHDQATGFCDLLSKSQNKPPDIVYQLIYEANLNMSAALCFRRGQHYEYDDPRFRRWIDVIAAYLAKCHNLMAEPANIFPVLWPTCLYNDFRQKKKNLNDFIKEELAERSDHLVGLEGSVQDLMDGYLAKVGGIEFPPNDCIQTTITVTTTAMPLKNAMLWLILLITKHGEIQNKIQQEVTSALGNKVPTMDDANNLPYLNATIYETLRHASTEASHIPHMTLKDTKFEGYDIEKGTTVFGNIWGMHYDTKYWDDPEKFKPDRFLDSDGKLDINKDSFVPFGLGKRRCPGEGFALKAMFLFLANVYQRYGFEEIEGEPLPNVADGIMYAGVHHLPPPYKIKIVPR